LRTDPETAAWYSEKGVVNGQRELLRIWSKAGEGSDRTEIARLAALPPVAYDREREAAAERLECRVSTLDRAVATERALTEAAKPDGHGRPLDLREPEPWPDPVDGPELLSTIANAIHKYLVILDTAADAITLWAMRTHAHDAFEFNPPLWLKSAERRAGKTRLCEVLDRVMVRPLLVSSISPSALLRTIEERHPAVILDELDAALKKNSEMAEAFRGLINSSFNRRTARHVMNVPIPGGGYEPREFSMWAPVVLSGIGGLPDTVADRAIPIEMLRKLKTEKVARLRQRDGEDLRNLARKAARWAQDHMEHLCNARPKMPEWLNDRAADAWEPLFAIADIAGDVWPERARRAALILARDSADDNESTRLKLLADIRGAFAARDTDRIASEDLVAHLVGLDDRPWPEYGKTRKPISMTQVARLLAPLRIKSGTIRLADSRTAKGYYRGAFEDAFARYLPDIQNVTTSQAKETAAFSDFQNVTNPDVVTFRNRESPRDSAGCDGVTDKKPGRSRLTL
jgi:putative DNA primase/helicase